MEGQAEFAPRSRLRSVPYALVCAEATGDIMPRSVSIAGVGKVIDSAGKWVGPGTSPPVGACQLAIKDGQGRQIGDFVAPFMSPPYIATSDHQLVFVRQGPKVLWLRFATWTGQPTKVVRSIQNTSNTSYHTDSSCTQPLGTHGIYETGISAAFSTLHFKGRLVWDAGQRSYLTSVSCTNLSAFISKVDSTGRRSCRSVALYRCTVTQLSHPKLPPPPYKSPHSFVCSS